MTCERCGKEHDGTYGSGRYCSKHCAYKRVVSEEHKRSISKKLKGHHNNKGQVPWNKGKKIGPRSGNYYCPNKNNIQDIFEGTKYITSYHLKIMLYVEGYKKDECERCNWNEKRVGYKYSTCQLHHRDGNKFNNSLENLEILCPNCHSLTESYCKSKKSIGKKPRKRNCCYNNAE